METNFDLVEVSKAIGSGIKPEVVVPFKHISTGSDRCVFRVDNHRVIKFSKRPSAEQNQNTRESYFYRQVNGSRLASKFAEILESVDGRYIVQEYVDTSSSPMVDEIKQWREYVESRGVTVHDCKPENFGYREEELVMVDFSGCYF